MNRSITNSVLSLTTLVMGGIAAAQDYPNKPITMVMPFAAGGPGDALARAFGQAMTKVLGQTILVDNTSGAGGTIGSSKVAKAAPDGYTLLMTHISHATNPALYRKMPYDTLTDFASVAMVAEVPMAVVGKKDFAPAGFKELMSHVQTQKDKVTYANAGIGSASHLCGLLLQTALKSSVTTVGYKGTGPAMNDLVGGQVDFMCDQVSNVVQQVNAGRIKAYGVTSTGRVAQLPNQPTLAEAGLAKFELGVWYGIYAPKGTPKPVVDKLVSTLQTVLADKEFTGRLAQLGVVTTAPDRARPEVLAAQVKAEIDKWGPIIKAAGVYAD